MNITAQIIGITAMIFNVLSFQFKEQKYIVTMQFLGSILFAANMFMLGAIMGGLLNIIGIARAIVFLNYEKIHRYRNVWVFVFILLYMISYVCTFIFLGKEISIFNLFVEFLPVIGMVTMTIAFSIGDADTTRKLGLINSPVWFIYNFINNSIGGTISEGFCFASVICGIMRYRGEKDE